MRAKLTIGTALVVGVLVALVVRCAPSGWEGCTPAPGVAHADDAARARGPTSAGPAPSLAAPNDGCTSHHARACDAGDAWWFDSCGGREDRADTCGDNATCIDGACSALRGSACGDLDERGRCDGDTVRYCQVGHARSFDCSTVGMHCRRNADDEPDCVSIRTCPDADRCSTTGAVTCVDGQRTEVRCGATERCEIDDQKHARCVARLPLATRPCHGCPCPSDSPAALADPIPVIAFIVADDDGHTVESEARVRKSFAAAAESFAAAGVPLVLREVRTLRRPDWVAANRATIRAAQSDPEIRPRDKPFFVPIVFVRSLRIGARSTPGLGTMPGGSCADLPPHDPIDDSGVIVIAHLRYPTTLAHELGHYFGLCHTHQPDSPVPHLLFDDTGVLASCPACGVTGDGVCDTPVDPGSREESAPGESSRGDCTLDADRCTVACASGATPDPLNLMSYYVACRRVFSDEQAMYLRRYAKLRAESRR